MDGDILFIDWKALKTQGSPFLWLTFCHNAQVFSQDRYSVFPPPGCKIYSIDSKKSQEIFFFKFGSRCRYACSGPLA